MLTKSIGEVKALVRKYFDDDILAFSSQLAYNFLLACFPFLIFLITLISNFGLNSQLFFEILKNILPNNSYELIYNTLGDIVQKKHTTLLSISIILTIWTASVGFNAVIKGLNRAYGIKETRPFWKTQLINITYTIIFAVGIVFTMVVLSYGSIENKEIIKNTGYEEFFSISWRISEYLILIVFLIAIFACVYRYGPCFRMPWRNVFPGAILAVIGWIVASYLFAYYANYYARYTDLYGNVAAIIVLMIWLFISSNIILIGGEINGVLYSKNIKRV